MALAAINFAVQDEAGNALTNVSIEVRREIPGQPLVQLYSDRDGLMALGNPFVAANGAHVSFHVVGGAYRIKVTKDGLERIWRYEGIGTAQEVDSDDVNVTRTVSAAGAITVLASDRIIIIDRAVAEAAAINLCSVADAVADGMDDLEIIDAAGVFDTHNQTLVRNGTDEISFLTSYPLTGKGMRIKLKPYVRLGAPDQWLVK